MVALLVGRANAQSDWSWTVETGLPGENWQSVWATSPDQIFTSGGYRGLYAFDGVSWSAIAHPAGNNRYRLWGMSPFELWSAGQSNLLRYDGLNWSQVLATPDELFDVWGTGSNDLFVVGDGTLRHFDGIQWTGIPTGLTACYMCDRLEGVWGTSSSDVFAVGWHGRVVHWDGASASVMSTPAGSGVMLTAIHGTGPTAIYAVGEGGTILQYDGMGWSQMESATSEFFTSVWAYAANDVYAGTYEGSLFHFDGNTWSRVAQPFGRGFSDLYGMALGGTRYLFGTGFSLPTDVPGARGALVTGSIDERLSAAPEPSSAILLLTGLALLGIRRARRRRTLA